ncbi:hypothetical protein LHFGNBLO_002042 [Mesorhizobium sp. AR10]|uniref:hypothetical protein n=1 Tax=Mesorhizobium sp. AR10 TaxID=2865839 RepID=UPI00215E23D3|nr:hypothetical protein [Mesorhizobium sp. AR10]UVK40566.1 hypothetical protein LHFGNBLO_002042 [Mesorhizobium sp. AR10]
MSQLEYHYETIGRVLKHLIDRGLRKVDLDGSDARNIIPEQEGREDEWDVENTFDSVIHWMIDEGLLRASSIQQDEDCDIFNGVQLTSKDLAVIKKQPSGQELDGSIEEILKDEKKTALSADVYTKIGSLVGGAAGGFIQAIGGG